MNIKFRNGSEEVEQKILDRAESKLLKLSRLIPERNDDVLVYVDMERESGAHANSESLWRTTVSFDNAGEQFNTTKVAATLEKSTDLAIKDMVQNVRRENKKKKTAQRKEGGFFKRISQRFG